MGPEDFGEEIDDIDEEEKSDPHTVYASLADDEIEQTVTITAPAGGKLTLRVEGDDLHIRVAIPVEGEPRRSHRLRMTVARSALAEALDTVGLTTTPSDV